MVPRSIGILSYSRVPGGPTKAGDTYPIDFGTKTVLFRMGPLSHAAYAATNGYTLLSARMCNLTNVWRIQPAEWVKVFLLRACMRALPSLTLLLWVDADAVFNSLSPPIEQNFAALFDAPSKLLASCSVFLPSDFKHERLLGLNTGVLLLRNDEAALHLLDRLVADAYDLPEQRWKPFPEQRALSAIVGSEYESHTTDHPACRSTGCLFHSVHLRFLENATARNNVTILPLSTTGSSICICRGSRRRTFFSTLEHNPSDLKGGYSERRYQPGDFLAHFTGGNPPKWLPTPTRVVQGWMGHLLGLKAEWDVESAAVLRLHSQTKLAIRASPALPGRDTLSYWELFSSLALNSTNRPELSQSSNTTHWRIIRSARCGTTTGVASASSGDEWHRQQRHANDAGLLPIATGTASSCGRRGVCLQEDHLGARGECLEPGSAWRQVQV
mmetsp:Transcript_2773/g.7735  ORF Transcript_2773/g.7735 Transcript_2773/m.7735 type:complete len:442 (+) Transcript_2773:63-1388(+)